MESHQYVQENIELHLNLQASLKLINDSLLCAICKEVFATPVMITVCSHNFCSICIRRYFTIKQECPLCGLEASTGQLVPNRVIETLLKHFNSLKCVFKNVFEKSLLEKHDAASRNVKKSETSLKIPISIGKKSSCELVDLTEEHESSEASLNKTSDRSVSDLSQPEATPLFSLGLKEFCTQSQGFPTQTVDSEKSSQKIVESLRTLAPPRTSTSTTELHCVSHGMNSEASQESSKADCPVCGIEIATTVINAHLDSCLAREEKKNSLRKNTPKRIKRNNPPTAKLAYGLLSLRDLRKKLKEIGLPVNGDKNDLKRRHQEFLIKYQAEMDKTEPRNVTVLIEELKREESSKKEMEKKQSFVGKLSPVKSPDIATVNQEHIRHFAKQYKQLEEIAEKSLPKKRRKLNAERKLFKKQQAEEQVASSSEANKHDSESIVPDSCPSLVSNNGELSSIYSAVSTSCRADERNGGESPELYVDEPCTSGLKTSNLKQTVESDSQADEIKSYIDASLSEAY